MISVERLAKRFGKVQAVRDVSFEAPDGAITGLLGPNGAGKTTTLRMLYGLTRADSGRALVDGISTADDPARARSKLGVLPDARGLYPRLTAREHIRYFGRLHGLDESELERQTGELIEMGDLKSVIDRRVQGFSQGERAKVAIARALVHDPQNVVLDEPTLGLDVMSTRSMRRFIQSLRQAGKCVLFSSHVMQEVGQLCDHIIVVGAGVVRATGTPDELKKQTGQTSLEDAFVAAIGTDEGLVA